MLLRAELPAEAPGWFAAPRASPQPVRLIKGLSLRPPGGPRRAWGALWSRCVTGPPPPAGAGPGTTTWTEGRTREGGLVLGH